MTNKLLTASIQQLHNPIPQSAPAINAAEIPACDPFLKITDVENIVSLKKSTIYDLVKKGEFPTPINLGQRASRWLLSEVSAWQKERVTASRKAA
jgi:prophage regulatory protein